MRIIRSILLPMVAVAVTLWGVWAANRPVPIAQSSVEQVRQEAERGGYRLIDIESLRKLYQVNREKILLVDTRQEWEHRAGHIDGSVNFPMAPTWWARWHTRGELKTLLGPDEEKTVVFY
jgi:rhodanese-related sulfurtransferase